jgi:hypothetical protein
MSSFWFDVLIVAPLLWSSVIGFFIYIMVSGMKGGRDARFRHR